MRGDAIGLAVVATVLVCAVVTIALKTGKAGFLIRSLDVDRATSPKTYWLIVGTWIALAVWAWSDALLKP